MKQLSRQFRHAHSFWALLSFPKGMTQFIKNLLNFVFPFALNSRSICSRVSGSPSAFFMPGYASPHARIRYFSNSLTASSSLFFTDTTDMSDDVEEGELTLALVGVPGGVFLERTAFLKRLSAELVPCLVFVCAFVLLRFGAPIFF